MSDQIIRDPSGRTIGRIAESNTEKVAYDASGCRVGRYDKRTNRTYDASGRMVSSAGDVLSSLLGKK
jgi:YD repeat-containing protein